MQTRQQATEMKTRQIDFANHSDFPQDFAIETTDIANAPMRAVTLNNAKNQRA